MPLSYYTPKKSNQGSTLLDSESEYALLKLKNKEFTFDVDVSNLTCGLNGIHSTWWRWKAMAGYGQVYLGNKAGAKYDTGFCTAQCPHDLKFINGEANCEGWMPSGTDENSGVGRYGTCCNEMDIWESNSISTAYTPHVCTIKG